MYFLILIFLCIFSISLSSSVSLLFCPSLKYLNFILLIFLKNIQNILRLFSVYKIIRFIYYLTKHLKSTKVFLLNNVNPKKKKNQFGSIFKRILRQDPKTSAIFILFKKKSSKCT